MRFTVLTLFPEVITRYLTEGVLSRAVQKGLIEVKMWREDTEAIVRRPYHLYNTDTVGGEIILDNQQ